MQEYPSISNQNINQKVFSYKESKQSTFFKPFIQPKLTINQPNDIYEQEADAIADKVMRIPNSLTFGEDRGELFFKPAISSVQKKCSYCEEEMKAQRKETVNDNTDASAQTEKYINTLSGGRALNEREKSFFEPRMGYDFSNVKIHTDSEAVKSAQSIKALAYTSGNNIVFNEGQYAPDTDNGKRLIGHELTHTIQQGASFANITPKIQRQEDRRLEEIKEKLRKGEKLTGEEIAYVKAQLGKEIVQQVLGGAGQIKIDFDSTREPEDINRRFQGKLQLRLTGAIGAVAKSLEGIATADIDLVATLATEKAVITIAPPTESNRMAALIREQLFPNGNIRSFDFNFPESYFKYAGAVSLISGITVSITGTKGKHTEGMILINHESVPDGVELIVTLSPSLRSAGITDIPRKLPGDHWILTPKPDIFGTIGYAGADKSNAFTSTLGVDVPLGYDTKYPFIYAGLGARASLDTNKLARVGGTGFVGLNVNPLMLQLGLGAGAAFLPEPVITNDGPAQTVFYSEVEGKVAYRIVPHVELLTILSVGGGKNLPAYGTAQAGVGFVF